MDKSAVFTVDLTGAAFLTVFLTVFFTVTGAFFAGVGFFAGTAFFAGACLKKKIDDARERVSE